MKTPYLPLLTIIFPIHNEEKNLLQLIESTIKYCKDDNIPFEILAIENGSTDKSLQILKTLTKKYINLKIFDSRKGWGNAVRKGIEKSKGEVISYMVSDLQVSPSHIVSLYKKYIQDDIKKREKIVYKITRVNRENITRKLISVIYNIFAFFILRLKTNDINATPKLLSKKLINTIELSSEDVGLDAELLFKLHLKIKAFIYELPIKTTFRSYGTSTTNWHSVVDMLKTLLKLINYSHLK